MNKLVTIFAILTVSYTAHADTARFLKNMEGVDCARMLDVLLHESTEGTRLWTAGYTRMTLADDPTSPNKINDRLMELGEGRQARAEALKAMFIDSCIKK